MLEFIFPSGIILGYFYLRHKRIEHVKERASSKVPKENNLTWTFDRDIEDWNKKHHNGNYPVSNTNNHEVSKVGSYKEAAILGTLGSAPSFFYYSNIDDNVMEAIDFSFEKDLSNFNDLHDYIQEKYFDVIGTPSADGWMNRLEGYVTEQYAFDVLTKLGHDVKLPSDSNQEGWDLLVDGQPWQVKGGTDPGKITEHFEKHPDIPIITSSDLKQHFPDNEMVVGYDELDPALLENATVQSLEGINGLNDTMGLGIPVITLAVSSFKEFNLLIDDKTELMDSFKNVALDVAGTGGGGFVGAQVGATAGAIAGPPGALIGGFLGGLAGAVAGRMLTNSIKTHELEKAKDHYINQVEKSKTFLDDLQENQRRSLKNQFQIINKVLNVSKDKLIKDYEANKIDFNQGVLDNQKKIVEETPNILKSIKVELNKSEKQILSNLKPNPIRKLLFPSEDDFLFDMTKQWFEKRYGIIDEAILRFEMVPLTEEGISKRYLEITEFFATYQANNEDLHGLFLNIDREVANFRQKQLTTKRKMFSFIDKAERSVRSKVELSFTKIHDGCKREQEKINKCKEKLRTEADKLGIEIPGLTD
ncbi:hypothetical protein JCM14036_14800 [Desulfotomaculum defluvii]